MKFYRVPSFCRVLALMIVISAPILGQAKSAPAMKLTDRKIREIDGIIKKKLKPNGPGVAVLILQKDRVLYKKGFGYADIARKVLMTPQTVVDLASVSKHFTAAGVLRLVQKGKLKPESTMDQIFESWKGPKVTVRQLLNHTSGLADYSNEDWDMSDEQWAYFTNAEHLIWVQNKKRREAPGTTYRYNNTGYLLLSSIIEKLSGLSYAEFMRREFFVPLGMSTVVVMDNPKKPIRNRATGYKKVGKNWKLTGWDTTVTGDGSIYVSLDDMAKWEAGWWTFKTFPKPFRNIAWSTIGKDNEGYGAGWGLQTSNPDDDPWVAHDGSWWGTATYLFRDITYELSLVVLSNDEDFDPVALEEEIYDTLE